VPPDTASQPCAQYCSQVPSPGDEPYLGVNLDERAPIASATFTRVSPGAASTWTSSDSPSLLEDALSRRALSPPLYTHPLTSTSISFAGDVISSEHVWKKAVNRCRLDFVHIDGLGLWTAR